MAEERVESLGGLVIAGKFPHETVHQLLGLLGQTVEQIVQLVLGQGRPLLRFILGKELGQCDPKALAEGLQGGNGGLGANVPSLDADFEERRQRLVAEGKRWRFVARLDEGKASVSLQEVNQWHPFYNLEGSNNIILLTTERYKEYPMMIQGYGAGASVTAAGVFADIMSIANI